MKTNDIHLTLNTIYTMIACKCYAAYKWSVVPKPCTSYKPRLIYTNRIIRSLYIWHFGIYRKLFGF